MSSLNEQDLETYRRLLTCSFKEIDMIFEDCMNDAVVLLSEKGVADYLEGASLVCMIGRGFEPVLDYLEEMPRLAARLGEEMLSEIAQTVWKMSRTPNGKAIPVFLETLGEASRRLGSADSVKAYIALLFDMMDRTTKSIHGFHSTYPSPGLPPLLRNVPFLLGELSLEGFKNFVDYGVDTYGDHPERQEDYFRLDSADAKAILHRERHGTLFADHERKLDLYLKSLWRVKEHLVPYSEGLVEQSKRANLMPYFDSLGIRVPDVFDDVGEGETLIKGIDRYRAVLAHMAAHKRWTEPVFADNFSPLQRMAIEMFEDCRIEHLAMREYPGLRRLFLGLHPKPGEDDCRPEQESCIRHRLAMFSYAVLDPDHGYTNETLKEFVARFHGLMVQGGGTTKDAASLAVTFAARTRLQADQSSRVYFKDTEVDYRDDNRSIWRFIEMGDEEEVFDEDRKAPESDEEDQGLPPRFYPEWDYVTKTYRPDYVSLYESLHPGGEPDKIDTLLTKHAALVKRLKALLDLLKPQQYVRERYQEDGSELDLDVAIRSLIDFKSGAQPDPRINMSHRTDGRDIAVCLLLDLSASLAETPEGATQSILELSQEAVALLGLSVEMLGDEFAIAGFSSNTRHEVRYQHIKGYTEEWNDTVKGRLAAMEAGYSTRMGAALRHAGHYLSKRKADKKLLLVLTDGEPSDIDVDDDRMLTEDSRKAVLELGKDGIFTYCINLDAQADTYVADIFGRQYTVIDKVERLPEKLPKLFMSLTK